MLNKLRKPGFRRCSPSWALTQPFKAGGRESQVPSAVSSGARKDRHLVFAAMNIYGIRTDLRTYRTRCNSATGTWRVPPVVFRGRPEVARRGHPPGDAVRKLRSCGLAWVAPVRGLGSLFHFSWGKVSLSPFPG